MHNPLTRTIIAALVSSGLFLAVAGANLGFVFIFLPCLPFFLLGFTESTKSTRVLQAGVLASALIALLTGSPLLGLCFYYIFPTSCWLMSCFLVWHHDIKLGEQDFPILRMYFPVGDIIIYLACYGCATLALITAFYAGTDANLPHLLAANIQTQIDAMQKEYNMDLNVSANNLSFMACGFVVWFWAIALFAHAWIANLILIKNNMSQRPSLAITPFAMPNWLLTLMGICALASLIGGESMRFLGKASLIILLLPYFFQGIAMLHFYTHKWHNQKVFLFCVYFSIPLFWPSTFVIAGLGLWQHIKVLHKQPHQTS